MTTIAIAITAAQLITIGYTLGTLHRLRRELRQTQLLQAQMEEDHATLVQNTIEANNILTKIKKTHGVGQ